MEKAKDGRHVFGPNRAARLLSHPSDVHGPVVVTVDAAIERAGKRVAFRAAMREHVVIRSNVVGERRGVDPFRSLAASLAALNEKRQRQEGTGGGRSTRRGRAHRALNTRG